MIFLSPVLYSLNNNKQDGNGDVKDERVDLLFMQEANNVNKNIINNFLSLNGGYHTNNASSSCDALLES